MLENLFDEEQSLATERLAALLRDPSVTQICVNDHTRIFFWDNSGQRMIQQRLFGSSEAYVTWLEQLLTLTDAGVAHLEDAESAVIEASFLPYRTDLYGSVHVSTSDITRGDPALTIRKQPVEVVTLDAMLMQGVINEDMRLFLQQAVQGRASVLISGASGSGKSTMMRALSQFIDPSQRIITCEEIDELHLADRLPNVVSLTTHRKRDAAGRIIREQTLEDLVHESLRMRADRIFVGEVRGAEARALIKAASTGHDGSCATLHAHSGEDATRQLAGYLMEGGTPEDVARDQIARAFNLVIQLGSASMGRRKVLSIHELEPVIEGTNQRANELYRFDHAADIHVATVRPSQRFINHLARYGVNYDEIPGRSF
ncbi:MAG: CpaF family protein [Actinomycetia bacterium]|nr:CpaF family protein [Actinomycetes bacterium]MCP4845072.1 CpaF family protein [Actinomycetes bacterium]